MTNQYYPNNVIRHSVTFTNSGGALADPSSVYAAVFYDATSQSVTSVDVGSVVHPSTGLYYFDFEVESHGILGTRWTSRGSHISEGFHAIQVTYVPFS